jgi:exopolysaccharide biosynthesis polyprenyl glycosylphosphotransferase
MIRRHGTTLRALLMLADAAVAMVVVVIIYQLRFLVLPGEAPPSDALFNPPWAPVVIYAGAWVAILYATGQYRLRAHWSLATQARGIARATVWLAVVIFGALYLTRLGEVSRAFVLVLFPAQWAATTLSRVAITALFMRIRSRGGNQRFMVVVGAGTHAISFARRVADQPMLGVQVIGIVADTPPGSAVTLRHLGTIADFRRILKEHVIDEVAICLAPAESAHVDEIAQLAQEEGKIVRIPLDIPQPGHGWTFFEDLDGTPVLTMLRGPDRLAALGLKRFIDLVGAGISLVVLSPLLLGVAAFVAIRGGGHVIFAQERVGMNGRRFRMYKFRTMVTDAEARYDEVAHLSDTRGPAFKMIDDPRVTSWGRVLRRTSLDELPQLWNVLKGDMSLVGPRPAPPREVDIYDPWHRRRLSMKPGLTGLWQISSRIDEDFDERASLDLDYIDRWSLLLDLKVLLRTVPVVLRPTGH